MEEEQVETTIKTPVVVEEVEIVMSDSQKFWDMHDKMYKESRKNAGMIWYNKVWNNQQKQNSK